MQRRVFGSINNPLHSYIIRQLELMPEFPFCVICRFTNTQRQRQNRRSQSSSNTSSQTDFFFFKDITDTLIKRWLKPRNCLAFPLLPCTFLAPTCASGTGDPVENKANTLGGRSRLCRQTVYHECRSASRNNLVQQSHIAFRRTCHLTKPGVCFSHYVDSFSRE